MKKYSKLIDNKEGGLLIAYDRLLNQTELVFNALKKHLGTQS
ncbi:MAG: hypothetical protein WBA93_29175 [Microcoleaceae cyanobacterium]